MIPEGGWARPGLGGGGAADVLALAAAVGLLGRALVVWVFVLVLLSIAPLLG